MARNVPIDELGAQRPSPLLIGKCEWSPRRGTLRVRWDTPFEWVGDSATEPREPRPASLCSFARLPYKLTLSPIFTAKVNMASSSIWVFFSFTRSGTKAKPVAVLKSV